MTMPSLDNKRMQDWMLAILALALFLSPWLAGFAAVRVAAWSACVAAVVLAYLAFASLSESRQWEEWVTLVLGGWLIAAPWVLGFAGAAARVHCAVGALTVIVSCWAEWSFRHAEGSKP